MKIHLVSRGIHFCVAHPCTHLTPAESIMLALIKDQKKSLYIYIHLKLLVHKYNEIYNINPKELMIVAVVGWFRSSPCAMPLCSVLVIAVFVLFWVDTRLPLLFITPPPLLPHSPTPGTGQAPGEHRNLFGKV